MRRPARLTEWSVAAFLIGFMAFSPPILAIFGAEVMVFGLPLLYLYLFVTWALLILSVAWIAGFGIGSPSDQAERDRPSGAKAD